MYMAVGTYFDKVQYETLVKFLLCSSQVQGSLFCSLDGCSSCGANMLYKESRAAAQSLS